MSEEYKRQTVGELSSTSLYREKQRRYLFQVKEVTK